MKNFSELLDTRADLELVVELSSLSDQSWCTVLINHQTIDMIEPLNSVLLSYRLDLLQPLDLTLTGPITVKRITVDGFDLWPEYGWSDAVGQHVQIRQPFYQWLHDVTGQGWLLKP